MNQQAPDAHHQDLIHSSSGWTEMVHERLAILTPLSVPSVSLITAGVNAGYQSILDLGEGWGRGLTRGLRALEALSGLSGISARVSMSEGRASWRAEQLSPWVTSGLISRVLIDESEDWGLWSALKAQAPSQRYQVWVEARTEAGARRAIDDSRISGVILVGSEAAGACGERSVYLWLQDLERLGVALRGEQDRGGQSRLKPVGLRGGMSVSAAAAAVVAGVEVVILDEHLIGVRELTIPTAFNAMYPRLSREHSERRLVIKSAHGRGASRQLPSPEERAARYLHWPQTFGWSLSQEHRDPEAPLSASWGDDLNSQLVPLGACWPHINSAVAHLKSELGGEAPRCVEVINELAHRVSQRISSAAHRPATLCPPQALATGLQIRYPIFQGPMTRVSDQPAFALAIAEDGALPFLALSLLTPDKARALLEETRELLGDKPWGVGILGFSPPELREAHLELVRAFKPAAVLIAGGRPSQSRALEAEGIPTYLHAPSPALLEMFIKEGARRFVFEGSECGGHIGPLSSAALWDAQLETLQRQSDLSELELLFAGGIHDATSAGLLTVMASEVAARGAKIGVVMGTAYLFTREAVETGAISQLYQDTALEASQTVTLQTAPGHATRCAESPFVREFEQTRAQLIDEGVTERERWAELEQLNVGRLRVASKGIKRSGDELIEVSREEQHREGMYMLGEVATLRREVTTLRALHDQVALESADWLSGRLSALSAPHISEGLDVTSRSTEESLVDSRREEIAIIGVASLFPKAGDTERFWENIIGQVDAITEVPETRWSTERYYDPDAPAGRASSSRWGGFLDPIPFDAMRYGIAPKTLAAVEPVQLLALEVAARALSDAGYDPLPSATGPRVLPRESTSVIFGAEAGTDLASAHTLRSVYPHWAGQLPAELDAVLPTLTEDSFAGVLANVIAGRVANRLDLGGVNFTVDAACASSLSALDAAVKSLRLGESDVVVCGGADLHNSVNDYLMFSSVHALSKTGRCRPFDQSADGIALGEGVAVVVLKRLSDALRDGDRVYATVSSVAGSSDGKALGLTAPRREGQMRALRRAHQRAEVSASDVELVEAHGTGTVVGDRVELSALTEVFEASDGVSARACTLGSVKSQIGHTKCAAGMAGLIKVALSIYHRTRPPTLHLESANEAYQGDTSPFTFETQPRPWVRASSRGPRTGAVSAFGFGGTNFHAVLRESEASLEEGRARRVWPVEAIPLRGATLDEARALAGRIAAALEKRTTHRATAELKLRDLSLSALKLAEATRPNTLLTHGVILASDLKEASDALSAFARGEEHAAIICVRTHQQALAPSQVALLFPGQGAQSVGMMRELFLSLPQLAARLNTHPEIASLIFPPAPLDRAEKRAQQATLTDTRNAQPALGLCDLAAYELLRSLGCQAGHLGGHSYGELVALCVAGVIPESALIEISATRGEMILTATGALQEVGRDTSEGTTAVEQSTSQPEGDPGSMAAIKGEASAVRAALEADPELEGVVLANINAPLQTVISGPSPLIKKAIQSLKRHKLRGREIPVACAFHSPLVAPAEEPFKRYLDALRLRALPKSDLGPVVWSNQHARPYRSAGSDEPTIAEHLGAHLASPVRFVEQITAMVSAGVQLFIEAGPGRILSGLVEKIVADLIARAEGDPERVAEIERLKQVKALPLAPSRGDLREALTAIATIDCHVSSLDWYSLLSQRDARAHTLEELGSPHPARLLWWVDGQRAWPDQGPLPRHGLRVITEPVSVQPAPQIEDQGSLGSSGGDLEVTGGAVGRRGSEVTFTSVAMSPTLYPSLSLTPEALRSSSMSPPSSSTAQLAQRGAASPEVASAARAYFESMRALAESQSQVMLALLGRAGAQPLLGSLSEAAVPSEISAAHSHQDMGASDLSASSLDFWGAPPTEASLGSTPTPDPRVSASAELSSGAAREVSSGEVGVEPATAPTAVSTSEPTVESTIEPSDTPPEPELSIGELLVNIVSERTGYPVEMLDSTLDLESDLSIDSIKRIEVLGALAEQLGLAEQAEEERDQMIEELSMMRTLGEMTSWLEGRLNSSGASPSEPEAGDEPALESAEVTRPKSEGERLPHATRRWVDAPLQVTAEGSSTDLVLTIELGADDLEPTISLFQRLKALWTSEVTRDGNDHPWRALLITASSPSNPDEALFWGGVSGLVKSAYREPLKAPREISARVVWLPRELSLERRTTLIKREAQALQIHIEAGRAPELSVTRYLIDPHQEGSSEERRQREDHVESTLETSEVSADHPQTTTSGQSAPRVTLVTGGARGVTARCALEIARTGDMFLLCGRTPHPDDAHADDLTLARSAESELDLRRALAAQDGMSLAELKRRARVAWAQHEIAEQLEALSARGAHALYLSLDLGAPLTSREVADEREAITDDEALRIIFDEALAPLGLTHASIDSVIHGAGVIDDQRLADKSLERFKRVFNVKVKGAQRLWSALPQARRWVMFSSVAAALGNEGQVDYAAGNAALDDFAEALQGRAHPQGGAYVARSLQWGPWAGAGMVDASLARLYASRGVRLITLEEGVGRFVSMWRGAHTTLSRDESGGESGGELVYPVSLCAWPFHLPS